MSILTLFSNKPQTTLGPDAADGGLLLDAVLSEALDHEAKVTGFPIELGADITDHIIIQPQTYTLTGIVTDTPIYWTATKYNHADAQTRHLSAYAILRDLWKKREVFSIKTGFLTVEDVVLQSFSTAKDAATSSAFRFTATLQQVNIVSTRSVTLTEEQRAKAASTATPEEDLGASPQAAAAEKPSVLKSMLDALSN